MLWKASSEAGQGSVVSRRDRLRSRACEGRGDLIFPVAALLCVVVLVEIGLALLVR